MQQLYTHHTQNTNILQAYRNHTTLHTHIVHTLYANQTTGSTTKHSSHHATIMQQSYTHHTQHIQAYYTDTQLIQQLIQQIFQQNIQHTFNNHTHNIHKTHPDSPTIKTQKLQHIIHA